MRAAGSTRWTTTWMAAPTSLFWNQDHFVVHLQDEQGLFPGKASTTFTTAIPFDSDQIASLAAPEGIRSRRRDNMPEGESTGRVLDSLTDMNGDGVADLVVFSLKGSSLWKMHSSYEGVLRRSGAQRRRGVLTGGRRPGRVAGDHRRDRPARLRPRRAGRRHADVLRADDLERRPRPHHVDLHGRRIVRPRVLPHGGRPLRGPSEYGAGNPAKVAQEDRGEGVLARGSAGGPERRRSLRPSRGAKPQEVARPPRRAGAGAVRQTTPANRGHRARGRGVHPGSPT